MSEDNLTAYIRAEVEEWFAEITDRKPEPNEIERVTSTVAKEAEDLISTAICNLCS